MGRGSFRRYGMLLITSLRERDMSDAYSPLVADGVSATERNELGAHRKLNLNFT
jgi:hypothetical protein